MIASASNPHIGTSTAPAAIGKDDLHINPVPFFTAQASCLRSGLVRGDDPAAVAAATEIHMRSHERWLAIIRSVADAIDPSAADAVGALYAFHGRLVESLEQGVMALLPRHTATEARRILAAELDTLTAAAIAAVSQS